MPGTVAILDIGKTHAKLAVVDAEGRVHEGPPHANKVHEVRGLRALDVPGIEAWLIASLQKIAKDMQISAIVPVAHGAAAAYLRGGKLAAPVLDYETEPPPQILSAYRNLRDPFAHTLSPALPMGLNLGAQLFWQESIQPSLRDTGTSIVPWAQYWAWWLSGETASEATSLGCHTDLWSPRAGSFSNMAVAQGWDKRFAPLRKASDVVGRIRPGLAAQTGLPPDCQILCGLHDSNAALLASRGIDAVAGREFALVSTGTWFVAFVSGASSWPNLDAARDTLANVDVDGRPVPSARFMGGREYEAIVGADFSHDATIGDAQAIIARGVYTRPSFVAGSGPFPAAKSEIVGELRTAGECAALASLHLALMTATSLDLIDARGPVVLEGRFAAYPVYSLALASLRAPAPVLLSGRADAVVLGAARLSFPHLTCAFQPVTGSLPAMRNYAGRWMKSSSR